MENQNCRICSGHNLNFFKIEKTELVRCSDCNIVYLKEFPISDSINKYYKENYQITPEDIIETEKRRLFRIPEQIQLVSEIQNYKHPPAKILDIGCDKGFFLDEARRYGYEVSGIEPSNKARKYCENIGIRVFSNVEEINEKYNIIVFWHSLEHHINPVDTINRIRNILDVNGLLFIRVPSFDNIWRKILKSRWIWFQPENHYFHFNLISLRKIHELNGYKILKIRQVKPNNRLTKRMNRFVNTFYNTTFAEPISMIKFFKRKYEDFTGVELFSVARKID